MLMPKKKKYKLIIVTGKKCQEKDEYIDNIIDSVGSNFLNSDTVKIASFNNIKISELFSRQKKIIMDVAKCGGLNIIVNASASYNKKWKRIAKEFDLEYEESKFNVDENSDFGSTSADEELDEVSKRIEKLEREIESDRLLLDKTK